MLLLIELLNAMVLIPCDTFSAETEIEVNIREVLVGLILIKVPAIEKGMDEGVIRRYGAETKGQ